jgi:TRAP-type mannitol/chloroaromatic compound transport system permease small subunit
MPQLQPELALTTLSYGLVVFLGLTLLALSLMSIRKGESSRRASHGIVWFAVAIISSVAVIALLAGYAQKARSIERVTHRVERVAFGLE